MAGVVVTHGHEDHIGAIPFLLKLRPDIPVVGSKFTCALVAAKCREHRIKPVFVQVAEGQRSTHGVFECEYFAVNHSIPDALAIAIHTGAGTVLHTGDIKLDQLPLDGRPTDLPGMSRLGVRPERLDDFLAELAHHPAVALTGLCTHLADADGPGSEMTEDQLRILEACRARLLDKGLRPGVVHVANTAGAVRFSDARFDLVRPGIGLFGVAPAHTGLTSLWPVMTLKSRIIMLREVPAGTAVSYGATTRTRRRTRVATLPIGYADGYTRRMSAQAQVLCGGRRCKVLGPITMDMTMVDVTDVPDAQVGSEVVLIGRQEGADGAADRLTLDELAEWAGTIPWEVCCTISKRVPRIYVGDPRP